MGNKLYYFQLCIEPTLKIGMYSEVKEKKKLLMLTFLAFCLSFVICFYFSLEDDYYFVIVEENRHGCR